MFLPNGAVLLLAVPLAAGEFQPQPMLALSPLEFLSSVSFPEENEWQSDRAGLPDCMPEATHTSFLPAQQSTSAEAAPWTQCVRDAVCCRMHVVTWWKWGIIYSKCQCQNIIYSFGIDCKDKMSHHDTRRTMQHSSVAVQHKEL